MGKDTAMSRVITRRDFMKNAAVFSAIGVAPQFVTQTAHAASRSIKGFKDDRVLVVVQLGGGNDGQGRAQKVARQSGSAGRIPREW